MVVERGRIEKHAATATERQGDATQRQRMRNAGKRRLLLPVSGWVLFPAAWVLCGALAFADDPPAPATPPTPTPPAEPAEPPRTHVDTKVVGDTSPDNPGDGDAAAILDNDHHFEAGEPALVRLTQQLNLSALQKAQLHDAIERADAGAAALIQREHDLREMIAATTPQDPLYAQLIKDQTGAASRWADNRDGLQRDVLAILTPAQRSRFLQLQGH